MTAPRALLIQPPIYDFASYDLFLQPFGLLRVGRWLEEAGYSVRLLDCLDPVPPRSTPGRGRFVRQPLPTPPALAGVERGYARYGAPIDDVRSRIKEARPDVVLITTGMTYWYPGVREIADLVHAVMPQTPVIAGGVYATLLPDHCAAQVGSDLVIAGTADEQLPDILESRGFPRPGGTVPSFPSLNLRADSSRLREAAAIRLSEGCPFRCAYCASGVLAPRLRRGDAGEMCEHIAELCETLGISTFAFYDDALLASGTGIRELLEAVIETFGTRRLRFHLPNAVHLDGIDQGLATLMHRAGFAEVRFGLESSSPEFHRRDRKIRLERIRDHVDALFAAGFRPAEITAYLLIGLPGQDFESFRQTLAFARALGINISVSEYSPVPGTALFDRASDASRLDLSEPLYHNSSVYPVLSGAVTAGQLAEVRAAVKEVRRSVV